MTSTFFNICQVRPYSSATTIKVTLTFVVEVYETSLGKQHIMSQHYKYNIVHIILFRPEKLQSSFKLRSECLVFQVMTVNTDISYSCLNATLAPKFFEEFYTNKKNGPLAHKLARYSPIYWFQARVTDHRRKIAESAYRWIGTLDGAEKSYCRISRRWPCRRLQRFPAKSTG